MEYRDAAMEHIEATLKAAKEVMEPAVPVVDVDGVPLLMAGRTHMISAPPGWGKTMVALMLAAEVIDRAGRVVLVNPGESTHDDIDQRLRAVGVPPPNSPAERQFQEAYSLGYEGRWVGGWVSEGDAPGLIIVDSVASIEGSRNVDTYHTWWNTEVKYAVASMKGHGAMLLLENRWEHERRDSMSRLTGASYRLDWNGSSVSARRSATGRLTVEKYRGPDLSPDAEIFIQSWPDSEELGWRLSTEKEQL